MNGERITCDTSLTFQITSNDLFNIEEDQDFHQNITCDSNQGSIKINYLGGIAPYKLSVNNLFRSSFEANNDNSLIVDNLLKGENIITIEDPVEFIHKDKKSIVSQREVGKQTESFAHALKAALREDPDVILVGELRDLETIGMALTAAETGHLVFGTFHTREHRTL